MIIINIKQKLIKMPQKITVAEIKPNWTQLKTEDIYKKKLINNINKCYNRIKIVKIFNYVTLFDKYYICIILITVIFVYILYIVIDFETVYLVVD